MGAAALPLAMIGSSVASGLLSPEPDQLGTFENTGADPINWLSNFREIIEPMLGAATQYASQPVNLPRPDFSLPSYSGGGLPMPIGAPRRNPALFGSSAPDFSQVPTIDSGPINDPDGDGRGRTGGGRPSDGIAVPRNPPQLPGTSEPPNPGAPPDNNMNLQATPRLQVGDPRAAARLLLMSTQGGLA